MSKLKAIEYLISFCSIPLLALILYSPLHCRNVDNAKTSFYYHSLSLIPEAKLVFVDRLIKKHIFAHTCNFALFKKST